VRGNLQALFGKRPTEKDPAKGTSPAVDFTRRGVRGNGPGAIPVPRPGPTQRGQSRPSKDQEKPGNQEQPGADTRSSRLGRLGTPLSDLSGCPTARLSDSCG
jgi:hypothetical protein